MDTWLFCLLAVTNDAAINIGVQIPVWILLILLDVYPEVELLDHMLIFCLIFQGTTFQSVTVLF